MISFIKTAPHANSWFPEESEHKVVKNLKKRQNQCNLFKNRYNDQSDNPSKAKKDKQTRHLFRGPICNQIPKAVTTISHKFRKMSSPIKDPKTEASPTGSDASSGASSRDSVDEFMERPLEITPFMLSKVLGDVMQVNKESKTSNLNQYLIK